MKDGKKKPNNITTHIAQQTDGYSHREDPNIQISPIKGGTGAEYVIMDLKNKEPKTETREIENSYLRTLRKIK